MAGNIVAIVGRPNVGKSTLFNRLTQTRRAIVADVSGTTRDRQYGKSFWNGHEFSVIDTGGWVEGSEDIFENEIRRQVTIAVEEADVILYIVDVTVGINEYDTEIANMLRRVKKPILLVSNKADTFDLQYQAAEFYRLGLGEPYLLSAMNGLGTGELLDAVVRHFDANRQEEDIEDLPRIAVVGRPNAGKSSLINAFLQDDRNIVTDIAGTTRDSIYTRYNKFGHDFYLVDTAGIRRKSKVTEDLEYYSVVRSIRAIENADVCVLMIDATRGIESQDLLYYLPPFPVLVNGDTVKSKSLALKVIAIDVDTTHYEKFFGPKDVQDNPFLWSEWAPLVWLTVLMLVLLALGGYLFKRLRDNKPIITYVRVVKKLLPHQKAMKEIEQIKADKMQTSENQKEYYTKLTDTIRRYIEERYGFSAMEMTSTEIIERLMQQGDQKALDELRMLFQTADLVKFAKYSTLINENDMNLVTAVDFINSTKAENLPTEEVLRPQLSEEDQRSIKTRRVLKIVISVIAVVCLCLLAYVVYGTWELLS